VGIIVIPSRGDPNPKDLGAVLRGALMDDLAPLRRVRPTASNLERSSFSRNHQPTGAARRWGGGLVSASWQALVMAHMTNLAPPFRAGFCFGRAVVQPTLKLGVGKAGSAVPPKPPSQRQDRDESPVHHGGAFLLPPALCNQPSGPALGLRLPPCSQTPRGRLNLAPLRRGFLFGARHRNQRLGATFRPWLASPVPCCRPSEGSAVAASPFR
jgi:hypothetical protein